MEMPVAFILGALGLVLLIAGVNGSAANLFGTLFGPGPAGTSAATGGASPPAGVSAPTTTGTASGRTKATLAQVPTIYGYPQAAAIGVPA